MNRRELWFFIEPDANEDVSSYDKTMLVVIAVSLIPLMIVTHIPLWMQWLDGIATFIFVVDYILHWFCADLSDPPQHQGRARWKSFLLYPLRPMAIIDLLSILPGFFPINHGWRVFRLIRLLRTVRGMMVFKNLRRRRSVDLIVTALKKQREPFTIIFCIAVGYIFVSALIVYNVEQILLRTSLTLCIGQQYRLLQWDTVIYIL